MYQDHDGLGDTEPFNGPHTYRTYKLFSQYAAKEGIRVVLGSPEAYTDHGFSSAWNLIHGTKEQNVSIDACWDRCQEKRSADFTELQKLREKINKEIPLTNHPHLAYIAGDKYETYSLFPEFVPRTFRGSELSEARREFTGRVVVKPQYGTHGFDVSIKNISEITSLPPDFIIQPFVDSTKGIPGIIDGPHDLRVTMMDGIIGGSFVRYPREGLISNVSLGGKMKMLNPTLLPESILSVAKTVDSHFLEYIPRVYSIDFMFDGERVWVVELNNAPGDIWAYISENIPMKYFQDFCSRFITSVNTNLMK